MWNGYFFYIRSNIRLNNEFLDSLEVKMAAKMDVIPLAKADVLELVIKLAMELVQEWGQKQYKLFYIKCIK